MSLLSDSLKTAPAQAAEETAEEAAAIGRAALKKQREESTKSLKAALASHHDNGKAKVWRRRITTATNADTQSGRETRTVAMFERADAYGEREFLRLANRAAVAAVPNGWRNAEAVEAIGAEIVAKVLTRTFGRMPKRGSLGTTTAAENPDFTYLVSVGKFAAADAARGRADGLAAEVRPMAAPDGDVAALLDQAAADQAAADVEQNADRYLYEARPLAPEYEGPAAPVKPCDFLTAQTRTAVKRLAVETGRRPAAVMAAVALAIRPNLRAADWARVGYSTDAQGMRTAGSKGRAVLADALAAVPDSARHWTAADWRLVTALADLAAEDATPRRGTRHISEETAEDAYRPAKLPAHPESDQEWREDEDGVWGHHPVEAAPWRNISADSLAAYPGR